ncbi:MAG: hypothetical protein QXQ96_10210 [Sulfolobales archaeon]
MGDVEEAIRRIVRRCEDEARTVYELVVSSGFDPGDWIDREEIYRALENMVASGEISRWDAMQLMRVRGIEYVVGREVRELSRGRRLAV